jgi:hypothetical protein
MWRLTNFGGETVDIAEEAKMTNAAGKSARSGRSSDIGVLRNLMNIKQLDGIRGLGVYGFSRVCSFY